MREIHRQRPETQLQLVCRDCIFLSREYCAANLRQEAQKLYFGGFVCAASMSAMPLRKTLQLIIGMSK